MKNINIRPERKINRPIYSPLDEYLKHIFLLYLNVAGDIMRHISVVCNKINKYSPIGIRKTVPVINFSS